MSGETESRPSPWTTDTLKAKTEGDLSSLEKFMLQQIKDIRDDYDRRFKAQEADNDRRFAAQEKAVETAFAASQANIKQTADTAKEAVVKSELGVEKRSDAVYVTLSKLGDALAAVMPRAEAEERFKSLTEKLAEISDKVNNNESVDKGSQLTTGKMIAGLGVVATILGILVLLANNVF